MTPDDPVECLAPGATASRVVATLLFWAVPSVGMVLLAAFATFFVGYYNHHLGRQTSFRLGLMVSLCPNSMNAAVFALVLRTLPAIARHGAARLYVASATIGVVTFVLSIAASVIVAITLSGSRSPIVLIVPPIVAAVISIVAMECLIRVGWLPRWIPDTCDACGHQLVSARARRCPECGASRITAAPD